MSSFSGSRWLLPALMFVLAAVLFAPVMRWLGSQWLSNDYYSHGPLIPLVAGFFGWRALARQARAGEDVALLLAGAGVLFYLIALFQQAYHLAALAMMVTVAGAVAAYWGWAGLKKVLFPLAWLIFMIPFPFVEASSLPLSLFTGQIATRLMQLAGLDVRVQGAAVSLPGARLVVGAQCSGVRSIITLLALAAIFTYIVQGSWWRKALLFLAIIPIAIIGNIFRVSSLLLVANQWGAQAGFTYYHDYSGFVFFALAFSLMLLMARFLRCHTIRNDL